MTSTISLTFIGSTASKINNTFDFLYDVNEAFWKVALNILEEIDNNNDGSRGRRSLKKEDTKHIIGTADNPKKVDDNNGIESKRRRRSLDKDYFAANDLEEVAAVVRLYRDLNKSDKAEESQRVGISKSISKDVGRAATRQLSSNLGYSVYFKNTILDVDDIVCPSGLEYALEGTSCLEFTYTLTLQTDGPLTEPLAEEFVRNMYAVVNDDGDMYTALAKEHPETDIVGLGYPGKGMPLALPAAGLLRKSNPKNPETDIAPIPMVNQTQEGVWIESQLKANNDGTIKSSASNPTMVGMINIGLSIAMWASITLSLVVLLALIANRRHRGKNLRKKQQRRNNSTSWNLEEDFDASEVNVDAMVVGEWLDDDTGSSSRGSASGGASFMCDEESNIM